MKERIVILGGGESGVGSAILALKQGHEAFISDMAAIKTKYKEVLARYGVEYEEGGHSEARILEADLVIKSPGIPDAAPLIQRLREKNIPVISEIEFAGRFNKAKTICITGSNGKTTTTLLTYQILKDAGVNAGLAGNIGKSFAWQVAENKCDVYVLELSSFQLDGMTEFRADVAVLLNITPDHLDRYGYNMQNYINSKFRIIQNQTENDVFIYCKDDEIIQEELIKRQIKSTCYPFSLNEPEKQGAGITNESVVINYKQNQFSMSILDISLQGKHNTYNSMAAGIASMVFEIKNEQLRASFLTSRV